MVYFKNRHYVAASWEESKTQVMFIWPNLGSVYLTPVKSLTVLI